MVRVLLVDGTRDEHAGRVVQRVASVARAHGHVVDVLDEPETVDAIDLDGVKGVVLASSPSWGRHSSLVRSFVRGNRDLLSRTPSALLAVSTWAAWPGRWYRGGARRQVNAFLRRLRWRPNRVALVAGAVPCSRYGRLRRALVRRFVAPAVGTIDTARDQEYTDWPSVERFAEVFVGHLSNPAPRTQFKATMAAFRAVAKPTHAR